MTGAVQRIVYILTGLGDNGKSLFMADTIVKNLEMYRSWWFNKVTEQPRYIAINPSTMKLAKWVEDEYGLWPDGFIRYYDGLSDLPKLSECDVIIDEMGDDFNARRWTELPRDIIRWFATMGHNGVYVYGTAQDFLDVDITIRKKTQSVIMLSKICGSQRPAKSMPPVKRIWGMIMKYYVHYEEINKQESKRRMDKMSIRPFFITKYRCSIYDTLQKIEGSKYPPYKHIDRTCDDPKHTDTYGRPFVKAMHV